MVRRAVLAISLLGLLGAAHPAAAQGPNLPPLAFAGLQWGDSGAAVTGKLAASSFAPVTGASDDLPVYRGAVLGVPTLVLPSFTTLQRLNLVTVLVKAGPELALSAYEQLVGMLTGKYGPPSNVVREFSAPYKDAAPIGFEGIAQGKVRLATTWALPGELIVATVGRTGDVVVTYQPRGSADPASNPF